MSSVSQKERPTNERATAVSWSVATVKANFLAYLRFLQSSPAMTSASSAGVARWSCAVPHSWLNGVLVSRPPAADERALIADSLGYFRSAGLTSASWWVDPSVSTRDWEPHLRRFGFRPEWTTPTMMLALTAAPLANRASPGLEIREVLDDELLREWTCTMVAGFGLPESWQESIAELLRGAGYGGPLRHWVGYVRGSPAGISSLFVGAGVAALRYLATVPEARGRGVGAAMASHALSAAQAQGQTTAVLESSAAGYELYLKLGFRMVGPLDYYYWER